MSQPGARRRFVAAAVISLAVGAVLVTGQSVGVTPAKAFDPAKAPEIQERLFDSLADIELGVNSPVAQHGPKVQNFTPHGNAQCSQQIGSNVKVNQDCLNIAATQYQGRSQAQNETSIATNPNNHQQLVATSNDYRRGDGTCGTEWSNDGGNHWQDSTMPNGFVTGTTYRAVREYFTSSGDPSVAWDSKGNVYYSCQEFMRGTPTTNNPDFSSGVYLYRSTGNGGASWSFPGTPVVEDADFSGATLIDKPFMTVDNHAGSPFQDRVYVTWTTFAADGTAYIYEAHSSDYGRTFSSPVLVSTDSALCPNNYSSFGIGHPHGNCNENQFSDPFTGPDGNLYVVYNNYNNSLNDSSDNHNQVLLSKSTDGGASFSAPVLVADYYDLPDCDTYQGAGQDPFRACVPEHGSNTHSVFRATNYASGQVNPKSSSQIVVTFGSYINSFDKTTCTPQGFAADGINVFGGVKSADCANKILFSVSTNSGTSFTNTDPLTLGSVNTSDQAGSDQFWQWSGFSDNGKLAVSYYDRQYGTDETDGSSDISLSSSGQNLANFKVTRVTSSSMPVPTEFPNAQGNGTFLGDYSGLAVGDQAYPLWTDTRSVDLFDCSSTGPPAVCTASEPNGLTANDEDVFSDKIGF
jgi:hypothetical protein